jgi:hypothetical protein
MRALFKKHKLFWLQKPLVFSALAGFLLLAAGLFATYYANLYTVIRASNSVTDILLDNLPVVNIDFVFNEGALIFVAVLVIIALHEPRRLPFMLKSVALFLFVRSVFMTLTHLAPPPQQSYIDADIVSKISSGDDLFFSGHAGLPFLFALIFWEGKFLRYLFIALTVVGGTSVLLGHLHYSIDVFSALFIAFGIFNAAKKIFPKSYSLFSGEPG